MDIRDYRERAREQTQNREGRVLFSMTKHRPRLSSPFHPFHFLGIYVPTALLYSVTNVTSLETRRATSSEELPHFQSFSCLSAEIYSGALNFCLCHQFRRKRPAILARQGAGGRTPAGLIFFSETRYLVTFRCRVALARLPVPYYRCGGSRKMYLRLGLLTL